MIRFVLLVLCFIGGMAQAQSVKARRAIVSVDGAFLYQRPDFDSSILGYLKIGDDVVASVKTFRGRGGIGLFFAVRTKDGIRGFIADTDLIAADSKKPLSPLMKDGAPVDIKQESQRAMNPHREAFDPEQDEPLYFRRYLGGVIGRKGHSVKHQGKTYSSDLTFFGLRSTGPGTLFDGPPLDFNLAVALESPKFYREFAQNKPNGFLLFSDILLQLPAWERTNQLIYYGLGLMMSYSSHRIQLNNQFSDSKQFRLGGEVGFGYAHRIFKKHLIRLDYKYHFERFQNTSYWLSIMTEY